MEQSEWPSSHKGESEGQEAARKSRKQRIPRNKQNVQGNSLRFEGTAGEIRDIPRVWEAAIGTRNSQREPKTSHGLGKSPRTALQVAGKVQALTVHSSQPAA